MNKKKRFKPFVAGILIVILHFVAFTAFAINYTSVQTGDWTDPATWSPAGTPGGSDNVIIANSHTISLTNTTSVNNLTINQGGKLDAGTKNINVGGNIIINGTYTGTQSIRLSGTGTNIGGIGQILLTGNNQSNRIEITGNKTILSSANLTINIDAADGSFRMEGATINNFGTVTMGGDVLDHSGTNLWINRANSRLNIPDIVWEVPLTASASGNTVAYVAAAQQDILVPSSATYYNLYLTGGNTKTVKANLTISGEVFISSTLSVDDGGNNWSLSVGGDWHNDGTFDEASGLVTFNGASDQAITGTGTDQFYDLNTNKSIGNVLLDKNLSVTNTLTMTSGDIQNDGFRVILGTSVANAGTLTYFSGTIIGEFERWISDASGGIFFPIGLEGKELFLTFSSSGVTPGSLITDFVESTPGTNFQTTPLTEGANSYYNTFGDGYWTLTGNNGFSKGATYDLDVKIGQLEAFPIDLFSPDERIAYRQNTSNKWDLSGSHGGYSSTGTTDLTYSRTGYTVNLGQYALLDTDNCTPPLVPSFLSPDLDVCISDPEVLYEVTNSDDDGSYTYDWSVTGGTITGHDTGTPGIKTGTTNQIEVDWDATGGDRTIEVRAQNACSFGPLASITIAVESYPTSDISGRTILAENTLNEPYSVDFNSGYTYTWSIIGGTTVENGLSVYSQFEDADISVDWGNAISGSVTVTAQKTNPSACPAAADEVLEVEVFDTYTSQQTGDFEDGPTWVGGVAPGLNDNVRISSGHTVTNTTNVEVNHMIIESGGVFDQDTRRKNLVVNGIYENNGTHYASGTGGVEVVFSGLNPTSLNGTGVIIASKMTIKDAIRTVSSSSSLNINAEDFVIDGTELQNFGTLTLISDDGDHNDLLLNNGGVLKANAVGNTIEYSALGFDMAIVNTYNSIYYNLIASGTATVTAQNNLTVKGNLTETGTLDLTTNTTNITFGGSALQNITGTVDFYDLTLNNTYIDESIILNDPVTVANSMTFTDGILRSDATNTITLANTATVSGYSNGSHISGPMIYSGLTTSTVTFPVGKNNELHRVDLTVNGPSANYTTEYINSSARALPYILPGTLDRVSDIGYWNITNGGVGVTSSSVTLYYNSSDVVADPPNLRIAKDDGTNWVDLGGTGSGVPSGFITSTNNYTSFSAFSLANATGGGNPLPVTWLSVAGEQAGQQVKLEWATASETDNDFFTIQRSSDGYEFEDIGTLPGSGTTNERRNYMFYDDRPVHGLGYYRIKQTDFDGQFDYSKVIAVSFDPAGSTSLGKYELIVYPNPVRGRDVHITVHSELNDETLELSIIDISGRIYMLENVEIKNNTLVVDLERSVMNSGLYIVRLKGNSGIYTGRLVVN